jgi:hypothetical protein
VCGLTNEKPKGSFSMFSVAYRFRNWHKVPKIEKGALYGRSF